MGSLPTTADDMAMLSRMRLFGRLTSEDLDDIAKHIRIRTANRGETLFENGDKAVSFYGVISGWVKLFNNRVDGNEVVIGVFTQGETFAEATLFMSGVYPATAEVIAPTRLFEFERNYFLERFLSNPDLCRGMFASLCMHLHRLTQEIEQLQGQSSEQRLARFLLSLCGNDDGPCQINLPYEKGLIAGRLGMKPETLSRNFMKLKNFGVQVNRNEVLIENTSLIREFCS